MSMSDRDGFIWSDGKLIPWREANVHVLTHSLHYGMGVFEGIRAYKTAQGTAIFRLPEHVKRLFNGTKIFQMSMPYSSEEISKGIIEVINSNKLEACIHTAIAAWEWGAYLGEDGINKGIRVKTSSFTRHFVNSSLVRAKASGYYINSILANQEVTANGYDEALLLDTEGYVSEGSGENLFMVRNGIVYTPDLASCLDGITRDSVIQITKDLGYEVREKRLTRDEVYSADEAFFTGTAAEVTPIRELDDRTIGDGKRGSITEKIQKTYFDAVYGRNDKYKSWLTFVK
jgi:branched-chain amino acid aminotransferase